MGFVCAALVYAIAGLAAGGVFWACPRLRGVPRLRFAVIAVTVVGGVALFAATSGTPVGGAAEAGGTFRHAVEAYLFLGAAICHVPVWIWLLVVWWNRLVERMTGCRHAEEEQEPRELSAAEEWRVVESCLRTLATRPLDSRARECLAGAYRRLGAVDAAIGEYRKAADCSERGYAQARLLYKAAWLQVELQQDAARALQSLRRLVRLYPRSYFASYARRVINRNDAHGWRQKSGGAGASSGTLASGSSRPLPPACAAVRVP